MASPRRGAAARSATSRRGDEAVQTYWDRSKQPLEILALVAPLVIIYEIGLVWALRAERGTITNRAHEGLLRLFDAVGIDLMVMALPAAAVLVVLVTWQLLARRPWSLHLPPVGLMAIESEIAALAGTAGLDAVASTYGAKVDPFVEVRAADPMFLQFGMRMPTALPVIGADQVVADALADRAFALPPQADLASLPPADRTFVIGAPVRLTLAVVRIDSLKPMNEGDLARLMANDRFRSSLALQDVDETALQMFSRDALVTRYGYQQVTPSREDADDATAGAGTTAPAGGPAGPATTGSAKPAAPAPAPATAG